MDLEKKAEAQCLMETDSSCSRGWVLILSHTPAHTLACTAPTHAPIHVPLGTAHTRGASVLSTVRIYSAPSATPGGGYIVPGLQMRKSGKVLELGSGSLGVLTKVAPTSKPCFILSYIGRRRHPGSSPVRRFQTFKLSMLATMESKMTSPRPSSRWEEAGLN